MSTEHDEFDVEPEQRDADDEREDDAASSIFAAGWFRSALVLTMLAVVGVVTLPYLLDWFEPVTSPVREPARVNPGRQSPASLRPQPTPPGVVATVKPGSTAVPVLPSRRALAASAPEGVARPLQAVTTGVVEQRPDRTAALSTRRNGSYWVQLGVFKDLANAERLAKRLRDQGFSIQVVGVTRSESGAAARGGSGATYHLVRAGAFLDQGRAMAARDDLKNRGYVGFLSEGAAK